MTEEQFVAWCEEDVKAEWVDGEVVVMSPAAFSHVDFNGWLLTVLRTFVEHHDLGIASGSELAVRFAKLRRRRVPDVLFISKARLSILKQNHVEGPPDVIFEIISPDSESRDRRDKFLDYQAAGVREYWMIDRIAQNMETYVLGDNRKYHQVNEVDGKIQSAILKGFFLRPAWVWKEKLPKVAEILKHLGVKG